jgi:hypothetical protein
VVEEERTEKSPTFVRLPPCNLAEDFCISRKGLDLTNAVIDSERACRSDLAVCRKERTEKLSPTSSGWDPTVVVIVTSAIVLVVGAAAFATGALVDL